MRPVRLPQCIDISDPKRFEQRLSSTLHTLPSGTLPLQAGCEQGGVVDDRDISATVLGVVTSADKIVARVGIFFTEVVGGCNCNDDPLEVNAYCVLEVSIDRETGTAGFVVLSD